MHPNRLADPFNPRFTKTTAAKLAIWMMLTIGLGSGLSGCSRGESPETIESIGDETLTSPSDLENTETQVRITVPDGWMAVRDSSQRGTADIYASYEPANLYAVVLSESTNVLSQFDLENNAEQYRWLIREELDRFDGETRTETDSINGNSAVQYEIRGQVDGVPVVYLHTTVKGDSDYYQVVGWTTADSYRDNQEILQGIIKSFRGS